eukprot:712816-Pyramimonas_sp.AAC.1
MARSMIVFFPGFGGDSFGEAVLPHFDDMPEASSDDCASAQWRGGPKQETGDDLENGADLTVARIEQSHVAKSARAEDWAADAAAISRG